MNNNVALFANMPVATQALLDQIDPVDNLGGNSFGTSRRLSIRGGVWREIVNGKEMDTFDGRALNVVVLNAAPLARSFYKDKWKEGSDPVPPTCWSADAKTPDATVPLEGKQANRCADCKQNIKGSGDNDSRACRYSQRIAVLLADEIANKEVYQLSLPATSIFGDGTKDKMPMQAYARYLQAHRTPCVAIVTEMRLDTDSSTPKLTFKPVRPLTEAEMPIAIEMQKHEDTIRAITFTVAQQDGVQGKVTHTEHVAGDPDDGDEIQFETATPAVAVKEEPKAARTQRARTPKEEVVETVAETSAPIAEPTKRASRSAAPERVQSKPLADIIKDWGDDDA